MDFVKIEDRLSLAEQIAALPKAKREKVFSGFEEKDFLSLCYDWEFWARPN